MKNRSKKASVFRRISKKRLCITVLIAAIAAAWDVQLVPDVPVEAHDIVMTDIVTDKQHLVIHP